MRAITERRRALMTQGETLDCPYITDGLIFWLDGIHKGGGSSSQWIDLVGGKVATLYNCTPYSDCISFGADSRGIIQGAVSTSWSTETIEAAFITSNTNGATILYPPTISGAVGIAMLRGNYGNFGYLNNGASVKEIVHPDDSKPYNFVHAISINYTRFVYNKTSGTFPSSKDSWGANTSGNTYIGQRYTTALQSSYKFTGRLYAIRIYNRKLSASEMIYNQTVDYQRFGL